MSKTCFDYDPIIFKVGSIGEDRSIRAVHRESGDENEFATRTAFYGEWRKKAGGWLAEWNSGKPEERQRKAEDFDIIDVQTPGPLSHCLHTCKEVIKSIVEATGGSSHYGYSGRGKVFREDVSTAIKYKGTREGLLRPIHLEEIKHYLEKNHSCEVVTGIEADDACSIDSYTAYRVWKKTKADADKVVLAYVDKDFEQCDAHLYHTENGGPIDTYSGIGRLFIKEIATGKTKKKLVKGRGRMWLYQQILDGDTADNYFANSANPGVKWGQMKAYDLLKDCKTDKESWAALVKGYKTIYPAPRRIVGWRGDEIEVDAMSMLQENTTLAHMLRWRGDKIVVKDVLDKLGVEY